MSMVIIRILYISISRIIIFISTFMTYNSRLILYNMNWTIVRYIFHFYIYVLRWTGYMKRQLHTSRSRLVNNWWHVADPRRLPPISAEIYSAVNWCCSFDLIRNLKLLKRLHSRKYNFLLQLSIAITITMIAQWKWWKYYKWPYASVVIFVRCKLCSVISLVR